MKKMDNRDLTRTMWAFVELLADAKEHEEILEDDEEEVSREARNLVSQVEASLAEMDEKDAETMRSRIFSGEVFKGLCYGDELKLADDEQKACDSFLAEFEKVSEA